MVDKQLRDTIPEFGKKAGAGDGQVGVGNMSGLSSGPGARTFWEIAAIVLVAVVIIGGAEVTLRLLAI
ncbi:MAG: ABC transporter permease, partial [Proteobacteria bacterium]|nr:ABC transporter permease [Pseudomonadota bacterium]